MRESGSFNVADALAKLPGVSQMNTGVGISKPVIRGMYGSRVQAVLSGMRFDNQQWQDEHGLGLSDIELIKGPAGGQYLPFIPADKWHNEIRYTSTPSVKRLQNYFLTAGIDHYFKQNKPAQFETATDAYYLINAGLGGEFVSKTKVIKWSVMCNNLLNKAY